MTAVHLAAGLGVPTPACGAPSPAATTSLADQVECPVCVRLLPVWSVCPTCGVKRAGVTW